MSGNCNPTKVTVNWHISPESTVYHVMRYTRSLGVLLNLIIVPVL